jgi:hypothetical protein
MKIKKKIDFVLSHLHIYEASNLKCSYQVVDATYYVLETASFTGLISHCSTVIHRSCYQHTAIRFCNEVPDRLTNNKPEFHIIPPLAFPSNPRVGHYLAVMELAIGTNWDYCLPER